jgi:hypothetical protein
MHGQTSAEAVAGGMLVAENYAYIRSFLGGDK